MLAKVQTKLHLKKMASELPVYVVLFTVISIVVACALLLVIKLKIRNSNFTRFFTYISAIRYIGTFICFYFIHMEKVPLVFSKMCFLGTEMLDVAMYFAISCIILERLFSNPRPISKVKKPIKFCYSLNVFFALIAIACGSLASKSNFDDFDAKLIVCLCISAASRIYSIWFYSAFWNEANETPQVKQ